jgi:hypothetical protein
MTAVAPRTTSRTGKSTAGPAGIGPAGPAGSRPRQRTHRAAASGDRLRDLAAGFAAIYLEVESGRRNAEPRSPRRSWTRKLYARLERVWVRPAIAGQGRHRHRAPRRRRGRLRGRGRRAAGRALRLAGHHASHDRRGPAGPSSTRAVPRTDRSRNPVVPLPVDEPDAFDLVGHQDAGSVELGWRTCARAASLRADMRATSHPHAAPPCPQLCSSARSLAALHHRRAGLRHGQTPPTPGSSGRQQRTAQVQGQLNELLQRLDQLEAEASDREADPGGPPRPGAGAVGPGSRGGQRPGPPHPRVLHPRQRRPDARAADQRAPSAQAQRAVPAARHPRHAQPGRDGDRVRRAHTDPRRGRRGRARRRRAAREAGRDR